MIEKKRRAARARPLVRWHGGKFVLAPQIISYFPPHLVYVEPYGGGGSVLIRKPKSAVEIYNDLDSEIVNVFRVLLERKTAAELIRRVELTPYSEEFFDDAYRPSKDPVERAWALVVRSFMGHGADGAMMNYKTGFRGKARKGEAVPAQEWANYPVALREIVARIQSGVMVRNMDALELMRREDAVQTLFYVDPPYLPATRSAGNRRKGAGYHVYNHELTTEQHVELLEFLQGLVGMVVLSGYPSELYDQALSSWRRVEIEAYADGGRPRLEILWLNPRAAATLDAHKRVHGPLFAIPA
jgi:DNA adenine methylase